jgi:uncharacterized protein
MEEIIVAMNEKLHRFETRIGDDIGYIEYRWYKGDLAFMHTFVPEAGRGKGYSAALAKFALEYAKEKNLKIIVYCPFVAKYIKQHSEYELLINKQSHG